MRNQMWDAIARGANTVWREMIQKHPDTILTSEAAKQAVELLKQKIMGLGAGGTNASSTVPLPSDPCTVDWKQTVPFPDFSNPSSSSASPDSELVDRLSERIHQGLTTAPLEGLSERVSDALRSIPTPPSDFVWFLLGGAFALALAHILFNDSSSSGSSSSSSSGSGGSDSDDYEDEETDAKDEDEDTDAEDAEDEDAEDTNAEDAEEGLAGDKQDAVDAKVACNDPKE